jgi:replicative DNA helicase
MKHARSPAETIPSADRRLAPYSAEAELAVLGGMLIDAAAVPLALDSLRREDFYREGNRHVFAAMGRLYGRGDVIDPVTLAEELRGAGALEAAGGLQVIASVLDAVPTASNVVHHIGIVREKATVRELREVGKAIVLAAESCGNGRAAEVMDRAEQALLAVSSRGRRNSTFRIKELLWPALGALEQRIAAAQENTAAVVTGFPTGFEELDELTAGFQNGDFIVVAARPSMGKTSFATGICQHAAITRGKSALVFSLEMAKDPLVARMLCSEARVDLARFRTGQLRDDDIPRLAQAAGLLGTAQIFIEDNPGLTIGDIRAIARAKHMELLREDAQRPEAERTGEGLGAIVVDYLQLVAGTGDEGNREQEVAAVSRGLKQLARELNVPVVGLSQLSRQVESRPSRRPQMSDLRESGSIEQDSDVIIFLYRPEYYFGPADEEGNSLEGLAVAIVGKQRNGATGDLHLSFYKEFARFDAPVKPARGIGASSGPPAPRTYVPRKGRRGSGRAAPLPPASAYEKD